MYQIYLYSFLSVALISLVSLVGIFTLSLKEELVKKYISVFLSLAIGSLLGDVFIHLIPTAFKETTSAMQTSLLIIGGIFIFFLLEKYLHWHHHEDDSHAGHIHPVGKLVLISDGVHNFIDGIIIGVSFLISIPVGIATSIAVILHEIPQEIGDFAVLIHSGYSKVKALWLNFLSAILSFAGLAFAFIVGNIGGDFVHFILPIAAGGFIYISVGDLIPELQKKKNAKHFILQILMFVLGVGAMVVLSLFE